MPGRVGHPLHLQKRRALAAALAFAFTSGTIVPSKGSATMTFTRASASSIIDFEGCVRDILSGEAPFHGLRRVQNYCGSSTEDLTTWPTKTNCTVDAGVSDPEGGTSAFTVTATAADAILAAQNGTIRQLGFYRNSIWARRRTGTGVVRLGDVNSGNGVANELPLTSEWQRFTVPAVQTLSTTGRIRILLTTSGDAVDVWHPQIDNVSGAANQAPNEYVSKGALSAPYHGANVDGVKYFNTLNGNTVASNVVTEAEGEALELDGSLAEQGWPVMGYWPDPTGTNICLQSEDASNASWTKNGTLNVTLAGDRCGDVVLNTLEDADGAAAANIAQTITFLGNAVKAICFVIKKGTATSSALRLRDTTAGADRLLAAITWTGAVPTVTMTTGTLLWIDALANDTYHVVVQATSVTAANTNVLEFYPASDASLTAASQGTVFVGAWQVQNATRCGAYCKTTTASVSKSADALTATIGDWWNAAAGTIVASVFSGPFAQGNRTIVNVNDGDANDAIQLVLDSLPRLSAQIHAGGVQQFAVASAGAALSEPHKVAIAISATNTAAFQNGAQVGADDTSVTVPTVTDFAIGFRTSGGGLQGEMGIRDITYYRSRLPNATCELQTTL